MNLIDEFYKVVTSNGRIISKRFKQSYFKKIGKELLWLSVFENTKFLAENAHISERLHCIKMNITECQLCIECNSLAKFDYNYGYSQYCSKQCSLHSPARAKKISKTKQNMDHTQSNNKRKQTMLEKYSVETNSQRPEIKPILRENILLRTNEENQQNHLKGVQTKLKKYGYAYYPKSKTSEGEKELLLKLNEAGFNFKSNRKILNDHLELDGYDANKNVAIEYCGIWYHSEKMGKTRSYHYNKWKQCYDKKIKLYTIYEDEWKNFPEKIFNFIVPPKHKIYARNTFFKEINKSCARQFINKYHLQPRAKIKHAFGLYYNNELISVMTFASHHRNIHKLIMNRYCTKYDYTIIGGASKLIKNVSKILQEDIITWSDNRWSNGQVYEKSGWKLDGNLPPDYYWVDPNRRKRVPKQMRKKSVTGQPKELTETEYNESLGWTKIWDCGKIRWKYEYKK